jgi:hypothetical protein
MPVPALGGIRKHSNHLRLLGRMMADRLPDRIRQAPDLQSVFEHLLQYPGIGRFLAFQYAIDLNYSSLLDFEESFVIAGPGALDGIAKCFGAAAVEFPEEIIYHVTERQADELTKRGLNFAGLFGRPLHPIDVQNLFCEVSKYARVAHPNVVGISNRTRIKQIYRTSDRPFSPPMFPPKWNVQCDGFAEGTAKPSKQFLLI